jgi:hypothetical protein
MYLKQSRLNKSQAVEHHDSIILARFLGRTRGSAAVHPLGTPLRGVTRSRGGGIFAAFSISALPVFGVSRRTRRCSSL